MDVASLSMMVAAAVLVVFLALGIPIGVTLGIAGVVGVIVFTGGPDAAVRIPLVVSTSVVTTYGFIVVPMFLLMGNLAADTGLARDFFEAAYRWVGRVPGGLSVGTVVTCAGMAAITGSSAGTAAAMARIALPELKRHGYDDALAVGTVSAGGTLAIMIPPSTVFVIYAIFSDQSIGRLLIAGIFPGLLIAALYAAQVIIRCMIRPELGPPGPSFSWGERFKNLVKVVPFLALIVTILLGILFGIWTPVEASAVGVIVVLVIGLAYRQFTFKRFQTALIESVVISALIMVVIIGALIFSAFTAMSGFNVIVTNTVIGWGLSPLALFIVINFVYLILGMFLEGASMIALTVPLLMPVIRVVGWDPIWFGVIVVCQIEIAAVTPPVGLNLYAVKAVAQDIPLEKIYLGSIPFWICNFIAIVILYFVPQIALFLPNMMLGR